MAKKQTPEEAFYDQLTMGLVKTLGNVARICDVTCEKRPPCEKAQVVNWEQRHCVYLPEDMKKFYLSTDGFVLRWSYQYAPNDLRRVGCIHFPHLVQITLLRENIETGASTSTEPAGSSQTSISVAAQQLPSKDRWGHATPLLTAKSKIFELNNINDVAKVCIVYESTGSTNPKFYLLELSPFKWQFLADTFSEYVRMAIAHIGLPYWELCFSSFGLPTWTEQLFLLLAPHLLEEHEPRRGRIIQPALESPYITLDPNVFRAKPKSSSKTNISSKSK